MDMNEVTKEQINDMSDDELMVWHEVFQRRNQIAQVRKSMLDFVEIREAKKGPRIHVASKVIE